MSHQPFPKEGTNLIKNTALPQGQPGYSTQLGTQRREAGTTHTESTKHKHPGAGCWRLALWDQTQLPSGTEQPALSTAHCWGVTAAGGEDTATRVGRSPLGGRKRQILDIKTSPGQRLVVDNSCRDFPGWKHRGRFLIQPVSPGLSRACASCRDTGTASAKTCCGAPSTRHGTAFPSADVTGSNHREAGLALPPSDTSHRQCKTPPSQLCITSTPDPRAATSNLCPQTP